MEIYQFVLLSKDWLMLNKKFVYILKYFEINKVAYKNNPRTHSLQQKKI